MANHRYDRILDELWPKDSGRVRMSMEERAKIFMPFAALKGYEETIEMRERIAMEEKQATESMAD